MQSAKQQPDGFTLIEISVVLVIIGLLTAGVLVGRDLIQSAYLRAQMKQFEEFNTAINTFRAKYNARPGDMRASDAAAIGFASRTGNDGGGDNDGLIEPCTPLGQIPGCEFILFWSDLSMAGLIQGGFTADFGNDEAVTAANYEATLAFFPQAKISGATVSLITYVGEPYYEVARINQITGLGVSKAGWLPVQDAYYLDNKLDDGGPFTGRVLARYLVLFSVDPDMALPAPDPVGCVDIGYNTTYPAARCNFLIKSTWKQ